MLIALFQVLYAQKEEEKVSTNKLQEMKTFHTTKGMSLQKQDKYDMHPYVYKTPNQQQYKKNSKHCHNCLGEG